MKKDYLLYLKKMITLGCMITSVGLLGGCGTSDTEDNDREITESQDEETNYHEHLIVDIGDMTYIFRECDENISDIKVSINRGYVHYKVYDENNEKIIDSYTYGDISNHIVDSTEQEKVIAEIEETAIEKGAVIYRGLSK